MTPAKGDQHIVWFIRAPPGVGTLDRRIDTRRNRLTRSVPWTPRASLRDSEASHPPASNFHHANDGAAQWRRGLPPVAARAGRSGQHPFVPLAAGPPTSPALIRSARSCLTRSICRPPISLVGRHDVPIRIAPCYRTRPPASSWRGYRTVSILWTSARWVCVVSVHLDAAADRPPGTSGRPSVRAPKPRPSVT